MRIAGFGCSGCGALLALAGLAAVVAAFVPGVVNGAETGTAIGIGSGLCVASAMPLIVGIVLVVMGGKSDDDEV